jgi:hypothetical protein
MADEAFALSPISARATLPGEADYDAIREAFMETSRGRWFLGEYAKRNRNADTSMVLDAVARIEETIAAQRQQQTEDRLAEGLAIIRSALDEAAEAAGTAFDGAALQASLAPIRKGTRIIKEISWRWREIGADGRICDLIDSQLGAIEAGCDQIGQIDPREAIRAAFDLIRSSLDGLDGGDGAAVPVAREAAAAAATPAASPAADQAAAAADEPVDEMQATGDVDAAFSEPEMPTDATAEAIEPADEIAAEAADAHDEAVLEMVALEMGAPDLDEADDDSEAETNGAHVTLPPAVEPIVVARAPEPVVAEPIPPREPTALPPAWPSPPARPLPETEPPISVEPALELSLGPSLGPSLGSTLLASGILQRTRASASDPLAPIRRMSQAEKIAFFS